MTATLKLPSPVVVVLPIVEAVAGSRTLTVTPTCGVLEVSSTTPAMVESAANAGTGETAPAIASPAATVIAASQRRKPKVPATRMIPALLQPPAGRRFPRLPAPEWTKMQHPPTEYLPAYKNHRTLHNGSA